MQQIKDSWNNAGPNNFGMLGFAAKKVLGAAGRFNGIKSYWYDYTRRGSSN